MTFGKTFLLAAVLAAAASATAARAESACRPAQAGEYAAVSMRLAAENTDTDPAGIWTKWQMWNPFTPRRTTIWMGSASACGGQVVVSQIVNRQCSSAAECPARVVFQQGETRHVLLDYKQICTLHQTFRVRADLTALEACGQSFPLDSAIH